MASGSKARPKRFLLLKRKPKARLFQWDRDCQWLWAGYRNGKAGNFAPETFPPEMEKAEFYHMAEQIIATIDFPFLMEAHIDSRGVIPVGFAKLKTVETHVEPHLYWFWWSTPRARYEAGFKLFHKLAEDVPFLFGVEKDSEAQVMAEHIARAGTMRRVGTSHNWSQGVITALYETRE